MVSKSEFRDITAARSSRLLAPITSPSPRASTMSQVVKLGVALAVPESRKVSMLVTDAEFLWLQMVRGDVRGVPR